MKGSREGLGRLVLSRHAFEGSYTPEGVAEIAVRNEYGVLVANPESPCKFRARLERRGLGDKVVEVDFRCDPSEAVVDTWDRDGERVRSGGEGYGDPGGWSSSFSQFMSEISPNAALTAFASGY